MIKRFLLAIAGVCLLVAAGCTMTPEMHNALAKTCTTGETFYGYIKAAATTGAVRQDLEAKADQAWGILQPLCAKGSAATQTDIVLAGAQVYVLTKTWRDAT